MLPVGNSVATRRFPIVTLLLVLGSVLVFIYELSLGARLDAFILRWGATPALILPALSFDPRAPHAALLTLFTSQFIHAGWSHLLGNMLFLWVFGRAVEDRLGRFFYLLLYLAWGAAAALIQIALSGPAREPLVGASGAISGVLGAYLVFFPGASVALLVPIFFFFWIFDLPAVLVLLYWFGLQLLNGTAAITHASHATAGIAVWAHIGGFLTGMLTAFLPWPGRSAASRSGRPLRQTEPSGFLWTVARFLSLGADSLAALVVVRALLLLTGFAARGGLAPLRHLVLTLTTPLVEPFIGVLPAVHVDSGLLELFSVAAALAYWAAGALLAAALQLVANRR